MIRITITIAKMHTITANTLMVVSVVVGSISFKRLSVSSKDEFTGLAPFITAGIVLSQNEVLGSPKCCL